MNKLKLYMAACCSAALCGCIKNDLPYADVPLSITALTVSGQVGDAVISEKQQTVEVELEETVNPAISTLTSIAYKATVKDGSENNYDSKIVSTVKVDDVIDLSSPFAVKLSLFQEYNWTIVPNWNVERFFRLEKQMSVPVFDTEKKYAFAYIQKDVPLENAVLTGLKLGPKGSLYNGAEDGLQSLAWTRYSNYNEAKVRVTFSDFVDEEWTLRVYNFDKDLLKYVHGGTRVAWARGFAIEGQVCGFEYRKADDTEWIAVPEDEIVMEGEEYSAVINKLEPGTNYICRAKVGDTVGEEIPFSTTPEVDTTSEEGEKKWNLGFEHWHQDGKVICPWAPDGGIFWDSGNWGSTTLGDTYNVSTPTDDSFSGKAAMLKSRSIVGLLASGNLFIGKYIKTHGMNGELGFGRAFNAYPTKLTGYYKYKSTLISNVKPKFEQMEDQPDTGIIWVALVSGAPQQKEDTFVPILTDKDNNEGTYFDKNADNVIAYGEFIAEGEVDEYTKFTVELNYDEKKLEEGQTPTGLLIVCSACKYGDYFTGGDGSTLWVDEFKLHYDY